MCATSKYISQLSISLSINHIEVHQNLYRPQPLSTWWDERGRVSQLESCSALLRGWPSRDRQASDREDEDDHNDGSAFSFFTTPILLPGTGPGTEVRPGTEADREEEGSKPLLDVPLICSEVAPLCCDTPEVLSLFRTWSNSLLNSNRPRTPRRKV